MAMNPIYQPFQQPASVTDATHFGTHPPIHHPGRASYDASMPRDISGQGQLDSQETAADFYNPGSAHQYGTTPPQQYDIRPSRSQMQYPSHGRVSPQHQRMFSTSSSQYPSTYGISSSQQQRLMPYSTQAGYAPQPQPGYDYTPQLAPHSHATQSRARAGSTSSRQPRSSHRSTRSKRSPSDKDSRQRISRVSGTRPSFGDTMILMWRSLKGAYDARK